MRRILTLVSLALASLSAATAASAQSFGDYDLISVPHAEIDQHMPIGSDETGTPPNLQGLWWMDGNPLADKVVSFATVKFAPIVDDAGAVTGWRTTLPVYDDGTWSWHGSEKGLELYALVHGAKLTYNGTFNADFTHGDIVPVVTLGRNAPPVAIPQSDALSFTMTKVGDDEFSRDSIILGEPKQYRFRRIVDGHGNRLPAWDEFIQRVTEQGVENAYLARCRTGDGVTFPTPCAANVQASADARSLWDVIRAL